MATRDVDRFGEAVPPLAEKALRIGRRRVETGRARVAVRGEAEDAAVRDTLRGAAGDPETAEPPRQQRGGSAA